MYPLNRLTELVRKDDSISLNFKRVEKGIQIVITPALKDVAESESDESKRALYAALARPYVLTVPDGESVEDALNRSFDTIAQPRIDAVASHDAYVAALNEAAEVAKRAADAKLKASAAKRKKLGVPPAKAAATAPASQRKDTGSAPAPAAKANEPPASSPSVSEAPKPTTEAAATLEAATASPPAIPPDPQAVVASALDDVAADMAAPAAASAPSSMTLF